MRSEADEVPWFAEPPEAILRWAEPPLDEGYLHFYEPTGGRAVVPVTRGETRESPERGPVWHVDVDEAAKIAIVSPSIHWVGYWHSPNPCTFRLVDELATPE